jgi:hypothetical protein
MQNGNSPPPRQRNPDRLRRDGLEDYVQRQLLLDIEGSAKGLSCADLRKRRPDLYGSTDKTAPLYKQDADLRRAVENKYRWYIALKRDKPKEYW